MKSALQFKLIDLSRNVDLCVRFRIDTEICSFGSKEGFQKNGGADAYIGKLRSRMAQLPGSCVHVWRGEVIIGQIEMRFYNDDPEIGYVGLYYLAPSARGRARLGVPTLLMFQGNNRIDPDLILRYGDLGRRVHVGEGGRVFADLRLIVGRR